MKRLAGFSPAGFSLAGFSLAGVSKAAVLGSGLLLAIALPGAARAASFGPIAGVADSAPVALEAQFRGGRVGGGRIAGGARVAGGGYRGGRGYYRGGRGAGIAAGVVGAAILGSVIAGSQSQYYDESYAYGGDPYYGGGAYYGAPVYAPVPVYEEPVYVQPRRYYRRYDNFPRNPVRDPAGGGVMR